MVSRIKDFDELRRLKQELTIETERLNNLINTVSLLGSYSDTEKVDGGCLNNTEDKYINIIELLHKQEGVVKYISNKYYNLEDKVYNIIRKVSEENQIYGLILYERFIKLTSPDNIALKIHYCRSKYFEFQDNAIKIYSKIKSVDSNGL